MQFQVCVGGYDLEGQHREPGPPRPAGEGVCGAGEAGKEAFEEEKDGPEAVGQVDFETEYRQRVGGLHWRWGGWNDG